MLFALLFLAGMTFAEEITIPSGDSIQPVIEAAADGDVLILEDGGVYHDYTLTIDKSLTIKAVDGYTVRPVVHMLETNGIMCEGGKGQKIYLSGIDFASDSARYFVRLATGDSIAYLEMKDLVIHDLDRSAIRASDPGIFLDSVLIDNCHFYNFTGDGQEYRFFYIDKDDCPVKYFKMYRSSVVGFNRTILQINSAATKKEVIIDYCNFHGRSASRDDDLFDIDGSEGSTFTMSNSIISSILLEKIWDIRVNVEDHISNVYYWEIANEANMTANTWTSEVAFEKKDPMFVDAAAGDLTLKEGSPALTASATGGHIGDPRWVSGSNVNVEMKTSSMVSMYYNPRSDQLKIFNAGDVEMVEIYSLTGKLVASERVSMQETLDINTGTLQGGLYVVRMKLSGHQIETGKFVK